MGGEPSSAAGTINVGADDGTIYGGVYDSWPRRVAHRSVPASIVSGEDMLLSTACPILIARGQAPERFCGSGFGPAPPVDAAIGRNGHTVAPTLQIRSVLEIRR